MRRKVWARGSQAGVDGVSFGLGHLGQWEGQQFLGRAQVTSMDGRDGRICFLRPGDALPMDLSSPYRVTFVQGTVCAA